MKRGYGYALLFLLAQACQSVPAPEEELHYLQSDSVQLGAPVIASAAAFFEKSTLLPLRLDVEGVRLAYELTSGGKVEKGDYQEPLSIEEDYSIKVQAHHPHFRSSVVSSSTGIRIDNCLNYQIRSAAPEPDERYAGNGWGNVQNKTKASTDHLHGEWLGFNGQEIQIDVTLEKAVSQFSCIVSCLVNQHSWIFAPEEITVWASSDGKDFTEPLVLAPESTVETPTAFYFPKLNGTFAACRFLRIKIKALSQIPAWHPGAGNPAWVFIDEILIKE